MVSSLISIKVAYLRKATVSTLLFWKALHVDRQCISQHHTGLCHLNSSCKEIRFKVPNKHPKDLKKYSRWVYRYTPAQGSVIIQASKITRKVTEEIKHFYLAPCCANILNPQSFLEGHWKNYTICR